jgi:hypothetical protein
MEVVTEGQKFLLSLRPDHIWEPPRTPVQWVTVPHPSSQVAREWSAMNEDSVILYFFYKRQYIFGQ